MFRRTTENRRKHWYDWICIGRRKLVFLGLLLGALILVFLGTLVHYSLRSAEYDLDKVVAEVGQSALYDRDNRLISSINGVEQPPVQWEDLPQDLINAFVAREDESFFEHGGIVYSSVFRSLVRNLLSMKYEQGASTITMQLTRNVFELQQKTLDRKLLEAALAQRIEERYDKKTIFTQYLNRIYYGQNCYGISSAAHYYFGKRVRDLNLVECATLAGLVRAPSLCNPQKSMENAMGVKRETLDRMLSLKLITPEQHDQAVKAPIVLSPPDSRKKEVSSYVSMWAESELDELFQSAGDKSGGISVVTHLDLDLQQYVEKEAELALSAIEQPGIFPEAWMPLLSDNPAAAEAVKKSFVTAKRPSGWKIRGAGNDMKGVLQCCVLVVDAEGNRKGNVLALVSGRSAVDEIDRWRTPVHPGRAAAPLLFCCACLPGGEGMHIVARNTEVTGQRIGYDVVHSFYRSLRLGIDLPSKENEQDLYNGQFPVRKVDLARLLFDIQNQGRGYDLHVVNLIWSRGKKLLYYREPEKAPEYIRRESAVAVSQISPFIVNDRQPVILDETLPGNDGQWTMLSSRNSLAVFVWMGFDDPDTPAAGTRELRSLLSKASLWLAKDIYAKARSIQQEYKNRKSS